MSRDAQRAKVYRAEQLVRVYLDNAASQPVGCITVEAYGSRLLVWGDRKFGDSQDVQRYVDGVLRLNWVRDAWPERAAIYVVVREREGQQKAHYEPSNATIAIPPAVRMRSGLSAWALRELVVLHELAHHLAPHNGDAHGPEFVGTFVRLVTEICGPETGFLLVAAMSDEGAKVSPVN